MVAIPTIDTREVRIRLTADTQTFVVGANGSGKSALLHYVYASITKRSSGEYVKRISAHRQTWLPNATIGITPSHRAQYGQTAFQYNRQPDSRWMLHDPESHAQSLLFDIVATDNERARRIANAVDAGNSNGEADRIAQSEHSVFTRINRLLKLANLPVAIKMGEGEKIVAQHESAGYTYDMAQMSDGERNAILLAAEVLTAKPASVLIIDEPERHLHRSITQPLLSALFAERADCSFVISTHDVELPLANPKADVLVLYSCQWRDQRPAAWDAKLVEPNEHIPEEIKRAILGSRKVILFVEGTAQSLDQRMYSALFPEVTVRAVRTCNDVIQAVKGLRGTSNIHDITAFGLIDRDDRGDDTVADLMDKDIYALDVCAVESLYYCADSVRAVARQQAANLGCDARPMLDDVDREAIAALSHKGTGEKMASYFSLRSVEAQFRQAMNSDKDVIKGDSCGKINLPIDSPYQGELDRFQILLDEGDWNSIVARYPIKSSRLPRAVAAALRHPGPNEYQQSVVARIPDNPDLADGLRQRMGSLTKAIKECLRLQSQTGVAHHAYDRNRR